MADQPEQLGTRRRAPRQPADWFGFYQYEGPGDEPLRVCRVLDISPLGAGLELFATGPEENLGGLITVTVELRGETRNTSSTRRPKLRESVSSFQSRTKPHRNTFAD
jgi:hypothetical protein